VDFCDFSAAALLLTLSMNTSMGFLPSLKLTSLSAVSERIGCSRPGRNFGNSRAQFRLAVTPQGT